MFRKKKDKDLDDLDLEESEVIDFSEFEDFEEELKKKKDLKPEDIERTFIFHVENGCPICGGDVKGNDYYRYFCEKCNVLFDKKDILEKEFGKSVADSAKIGPVRKTCLSEDERNELDRKRKELKDRIYRTFSEEQKEELKEEAGERAEEEAVESEEKEEEVLETDEPEEIEEVIEELPEEPGYEEPEPEEEAEPEDEPEPVPEKEEYELETPDRIIASNQSTKMHKGDCHFVKKINPENRIYLNSVEEGEERGYEMCVCLRRLKAMQR
ncbi:hypothetical protein KY359_05755 [Candidatus Woesearchaeota archaeon]|nr:hypothetical protein [Candidatus Woesearchaeota archaeon]